MARRIDIELTSTREDGSWTWRAAGAREPKGVVESSTLPGTVAVGDVLRVEVDSGIDGTEIVAVIPAKGARKEPELLELVGRELREDELVTSKLVGKRGRRDRDDDRGRRGGGGGRRDGKPGERRGRPGDRNERGGGRGDGRERGPRDGDNNRGERSGAARGGEGRGGDRRERGPRNDRPRQRPDDKPRPKRLRAQRVHRRAVLDTLEAHERPIADEVLRGGLPAVRQAVEKQNAQARAEGRPEVDLAQLEGLAERLLPRLRTAEWRDRADAALAEIAHLDLRDLRTVVVAADSAAKDDESRAIAAQLKEGLERRIEADQAAWLAELAELLDDGRVVRALRVSSRPPKAGAPLPAELANRLTEAASAALTADTFDDRWATVLDALSLSPIHNRVAPQSIPAEPSDALKATAASFGSRVPLVAQAFGVEPTAPPKRQRRGGPPGGRGKPGGGSKPVPPPPPAKAEKADKPAKSEAVETEEQPATESADSAPEATEGAAPGAAADATAPPAEDASAETPEAPAAAESPESSDVAEASESASDEPVVVEEAPAVEPPATAGESDASADEASPADDASGEAAAAEGD